MAVVQGVNSDGTLAETSTYYHSTSSKETSKSSMDKDSFLQLLVAQMKYQDPLEPQSNTEFVAQFASFSQVEALQNMQVTYQQSLGADLVGKPVIMKTESSSGETGYVCGRVQYTATQDGKIYLSINDSLYDIDDLDTVIEEDYYQNVVLKKEDAGSSAGDSGSASEDGTDSSDNLTDKLEK